MKDLTNPQEHNLNAQYEKISEVVNQVFNVLKAYYTSYGAVMRTNDLEMTIRGQWVYEIVKSRVTEDMVTIGVARAKSYATEDKFCKWPSIGDFIAWCYELPTPEDAYAEASHNCHDLKNWEPSHSIVALAGVGYWQEIHAERDPRSVKTAYCRRYNELFARVISGEKLEYDKPKYIEKQPSKPLTEEEKEYGRQQIKAIREELGLKEPKPEPKRMTQEEFEAHKKNEIKRAKEWAKKKGLM